MPKIVFVGRMGWPVANTKTKRKKTTKKLEMALKMTIFIFLKNAFEFFFFCPKELLYQKLGFHGRKCGQGDIA